MITCDKARHVLYKEGRGGCSKPVCDLHLSKRARCEVLGRRRLDTHEGFGKSLIAQVSSRKRIERSARRFEFLAILFEPFDIPDTLEVHDLRRPLARSAAIEPLSDRFTNQSIAPFAALPGGLVELFDQLIVEVETEIHGCKHNRLGYVR